MNSASTQPLQIAASPQNDADLIAAARNDPAVFSRLYRQHVTGVYRYCISRVDSTADAEDLTAQVFIEVWEGLPRYRHRGIFAAWLFTIVRRRVADHFRQRREHIPFDEDRDGGSIRGPLSHLIQAEDLRYLNQLVHNLDEKQQELLRLRFAAGLKHKEIAKVLGKSEAAVKMALHRTLKHLQTRWGENDV